MQTGYKSIRRSFTEYEDEQIKKLVQEFGDQNWKKIAEHLKTRSARQCRERYKNYLTPGIVNGPWTKEEDELLIQKFHEYGAKWIQIASFYPTRSEINIKNRWSSISKKMLKKNITKNLKDKNSLKGNKIIDTFNNSTSDNSEFSEPSDSIDNNDSSQMNESGTSLIPLSEEEKKMIFAIEQNLYTFDYDYNFENSPYAINFFQMIELKNRRRNKIIDI